MHDSIIGGLACYIIKMVKSHCTRASWLTKCLLKVLKNYQIYSIDKVYRMIDFITNLLAAILVVASLIAHALLFEESLGD